MTALPDFLTQLATVIGAITGIKQAFPYPYDQQSLSPFAAIYIASGEAKAQPIGSRRSLTNVNIDIIVHKMDLYRDMQTLVPYIDLVSQTCLAEVSDSGDRFTSTISTFASIAYVFIPVLEYSTIPSIAYRFILQDVKIIINS